MSSKPVSVIIPTYNRGTLLSRAINSVLPQLLYDDELIVIDDGSSDNTENLLKGYGTAIRYYITDHIGAGGARNIGIEKARNPFLAFLDSDDEWLPYKLNIQRELLMRRSDFVFCYSNLMLKCRNHSINHFSLNNWPGVDKTRFSTIGPKLFISDIIDLPSAIHDFPIYFGSIYEMLATGFYASVITLLVDREKAGNALRFPTDLSMYEDWEFFGRLSQNSKCAYLHSETAIQHTHSSPRLTDANAYERAFARAKILKRIWGCDENYLKNNQDTYDMLINKEYITQINCLIETSNVVDARKLFINLWKAPIYQKFLFCFPNSITIILGKVLFMVRRRIVRILNKLAGS